MAVLTFGFKLPAICTAKFTLRASLAERLAKVDFKNSAPLAALTLSLGIIYESPNQLLIILSDTLDDDGP